MLFNSAGFLFLFLPLTLAIGLRLRGNSLLKWITAASCFFYAFAGHVWFLIPMLVTTVLDFYIAPLIPAAASRKKKLLLGISLTGNLGMLFYFKYSAELVKGLGFLLERLGYSPEALGRWTTLLAVVLPAGISFYTFQTLSYVIDVYRGDSKPVKNFWLFSSFVTFFPHLIAGPLTRHHQLIPGLKQIASEGPRPRWEAGIALFVLGLAKKVLIADRIANLIDPIIAVPSAMSVTTAWLALLGYSLQIYFDFSGYSDMAIGLGRLFGIELPINFNSPYQATNPSDFWKRWHITLSSWLRDYLYISLGGNRLGPSRRNLNLMVTMVLGGLWHGASWSFAVWGFHHGLLLLLYHHFSKSWDGLPRVAQRGLCFLSVTTAWIWFRAETFSNATTWFGKAFGLKANIGISSLLGWGAPDQLCLGWICLGLAIVFWLPNASGFRFNQPLARGAQFALGVLAAISILFMNYSSRFLYFQF